MPRVVVSKVEELPRELWFGRTGPLERLSLKRSIAKLEAAGLSPSWSRVDPLLAYLRECVAELGSYAKCAAVVGATRNMIRDACRGRYVPGFDRLLAWGRRLAEHSRGLSGLVLTVDLPDESVAAPRLAGDQDPGGTPNVWARAERGTQSVSRPATVALDPSDYTQGEVATAADPSRITPWAQPDASANSKGRATPVPGLIPSAAGTCPPRGTAPPLGTPAPTMRAEPSFIQGEPTESAPPETSEASALGVVSKTAPQIEAGLGVVSISAPTKVGEDSIAALETQGEHSNCTHCRRITLGEDDIYERQGVGVHSPIEHLPSLRYVDKKSTKKSLPPRLADPVSVPVMVVAEFRDGSRTVRAGCFDTEEQARRAIDSLLDAKVYEGEPYIDGRLYTRMKSQEELVDELVERKFQAMVSSQAQQGQYRESVIMAFIFNVINGVRKHGTVDE